MGFLKAVTHETSTTDPANRLSATLDRLSTPDTSGSAHILWGFFAVAALTAAVAICFTPGAERRFSAAISLPQAIPGHSPAILAQTEAPPPRPAAQPAPQPAPQMRTVQLSRPVEPPRPAPATADEQLLARLQMLEKQIGAVTGSIQGGTKAELPGITPAEDPKAADEPAPVEEAKQVRTVPVESPAGVEQAVSRTVFGVDLGSEPSFGALRIRWDNLRRKYPELARLSPRISVRDNSGKVELRLIAGPFENAADAAKACASLLSKGAVCDGGLFDGQRLPAS